MTSIAQLRTIIGDESVYPMTLALALLLTASIGAGHDPVCGVNMPSATTLAGELNGVSNIRRWPEKNGVMTFFDDRRATLWWIVDHRNAAFPAAICRRLGDPVRMRCGGNVSACKALSAKMARAKF